MLYYNMSCFVNFEKRLILDMQWIVVAVPIVEFQKHHGNILRETLFQDRHF